jgi:hypothetical protein
LLIRNFHRIKYRLNNDYHYYTEFPQFKDLIRVYNGKRGLHLVVVYLVVGQWRIPWSFRVWRGKGTASPAQLGLKLVKCLPQKLTQHNERDDSRRYRFRQCGIPTWCPKAQVSRNCWYRMLRKLTSGYSVSQLHKRGQHLRLRGLKFPVYVSWYYFKRDDGKYEKRFVVSTKALKASTISWWGKRRWQIEGWFKTAKHRFGLHRFGQGTLLGVYRWLILSLISYILAHWAYLSTTVASTNLPNWGQAAEIAFQAIFPQLVLLLLLQDIERLRPLALSHGIDIIISRCKI